jgi:hypothetical protein
MTQATGTLRRVLRFPVLHNSLFMAAFYFLFSIPIALFVGVAGILNPDASKYPFPMGAFAFAIPLLYGILGFVFSALGLFVYNGITRMLGAKGGIQVEVEEI